MIYWFVLCFSWVNRKAACYIVEVPVNYGIYIYTHPCQGMLEWSLLSSCQFFQSVHNDSLLFDQCWQMTGFLIQPCCKVGTCEMKSTCKPSVYNWWRIMYNKSPVLLNVSFNLHYHQIQYLCSVSFMMLQSMTFVISDIPSTTRNIHASICVNNMHAFAA